jgi:hypothetical protein
MTEESEKFNPIPPWRDGVIARHGFVREQWDSDAVPFLIGNGEIGGLVSWDGLGIPQLWMSDFFKGPTERASLPALLVEVPGSKDGIAGYRQTLGLRDGILRTTFTYANGISYESELFCSQAHKHLLVLRLTNRSSAAGFDGRILSPNGLAGAASEAVLFGAPVRGHESVVAWALHTAHPLSRTDLSFRLPPRESLTLQFAFASAKTDADACEAALVALQPALDAEALTRAHVEAWENKWNSCALITLPDPAYEALYYRSIYWLLSASGSTRYLPGEAQFSECSWGMFPFSYGAAGWAVLAFTHLGLPGIARDMLELHFRPAAFRANATLYTGDKNSDTWSFAHQVDLHGEEWAEESWRGQRHIEAFAAAMFHRFGRYYPDAGFSADRSYPVLRGTAEFWRSLAVWDESVGGFVLPPLLSVSEDLEGKSILDAVLAAKYCLVMAAREAKELGRDEPLQSQWLAVADALYLPQNDALYLEKLGDTGVRDGGGYYGVRAPIYLGYPTCELAPLLDAAKVARTLDQAWEQNRRGEGMISFVANWFALADVFHGRGDHALEVLGRNLQCRPEALCEAGSGNLYFQTSYASFVLVPLAMLVQSIDDEIRLLPAVPAAWRDIDFANIPAEAGIRVSGAIRDGALQWISCSHEGREIYRSTTDKSLRIVHDKLCVTIHTNF